MATTATIIISDAFKEIGVLGEDESPSAGMLSDGLRILNRLLQRLSTSASFAYAAANESFALTGQQSFTIGPTGDLITTRPIKIETATVDRDGITYPVRVIDNELYDDLTYKALQGANTAAIYYDGTYPNGTVYCYPLATGCTLNMSAVRVVKEFPDAATEIDMPEGYEDAIMLALAVRAAPSYGRQASPDTKTAARAAMKAVRLVNEVIPTMDLPNAVMGGGGSSYAAFMSGE